MPEQYLERARDVFVFQCYTGQRVSDLMRMRYENITTINGALHLSYIQKKTIRKAPQTVTVPLSSIAEEIIAKYNGRQKDGRILPFTERQSYNDNIKAVLEIAGVTRMVTMLDKTKTKEITCPINETASSHLARRTFITNIYEITQEELITKSMTGHSPNSKAITRYIVVKDSTKQSAIRKLTQKKPSPRLKGDGSVSFKKL